ncbi:hypothetical protein [Nonomuraea sp. NPDC050643]
MSDRLLNRLLPSATAEADVCFWNQWGTRCCIIAGKTYCGI